MSVESKSTAELTEQFTKAFVNRFNKDTTLLPKSFLEVLAKTLAGVYVLLYRYIGFGLEQLFVTTASAEETIINNQLIVPLYEWGNLIGVGEPKPATHPEYDVSITVENQTGVLTTGAELLNTTNGVTYNTLETINLDAASKTVLIRAVSSQDGGDGTGKIGNLKVGDTLSFINPLAAVAREATVVDLGTGVSRNKDGIDEESTEAYRQRIIERFRQRPQGGALTDYRAWALAAPGGNINFAYPSRLALTPGIVGGQTVTLALQSSTTSTGKPTTAELNAVKLYINGDTSSPFDGNSTRRPIGAQVEIISIKPVNYKVEVTGLDARGGDATTVKTAITNAIEAYFLSREPFIIGLDFPPENNRVTQFSVAGLVTGICVANGAVFSDIIIKNAAGVVVTSPIIVKPPNKLTATVAIP